MKHAVRAVSLVLVAAPAALVARGDEVDLQVRTGDRVSGTIRPALDVECFTCDLAANTSISATVKGKSKTGPAFQLVLRQNSVDVPGQQFAAKAKGGALKPIAVPSAGRYQVCVLGDGAKDGDYDLTVTWKPLATWTKPAGATLAKNATDSFTFSAPTDATATIDVLPGRGSKFKGDLLDVAGPDSFDFDLSDLVEHHFVLPGLPKSGEYTVNFQNVGDDGTWTGRAKVAARKFRTRKYDLRDTALGGAFSGDHTVFGQAVDEGGGTVLVQTTFGSPIDGAGVSIPADSLGAPVVITVSAGASVPTGGDHTAGPAVDFGPSGTTFDPTKLAMVTIPFDPAAFPGGDTTNMVIFVRSADGTVSQAPKPYTFGTNTVTFAASHFSTYQAATSDPRPLQGDFIVIGAGGDLSQGFQGQFGYEFHHLNADRGSVTVFDSKASIEWQSFGPQGANAALQTDFSQENLIATVKDDQTIELSNPGKPSGLITLRRGVSDDVLIVRESAAVLLRKSAGQPTPALLAGTWHLFHLEFDGQTNGQNQPPDVDLKLKTETGDVTFHEDGTLVTGTFHNAKTQSSYPKGQWTTTVESQLGDKGVTYTVISDGGFVEITPTGGSQPFRLESVLDGDVLVGAANAPGDATTQASTDLFVLVRASSGASFAKLAGAYQVIQQTTEGIDAPIDQEPPLAQNLGFGVADFGVTISTSGQIVSLGTQDVTTTDGLGNPVTTAGQPLSASGRGALKSDGSFSSADLGFLGAPTRDDLFFVYVDPTKSGQQRIGFGIRLLK